MTTPVTALDPRYSHPDAVAAGWDETCRVLEEARVFRISTVGSDGRPYVTPCAGRARSSASRDGPGRLLLVQSGYLAEDGYGLNWFLRSGCAGGSPGLRPRPPRRGRPR